jgi:3-hydroxyacyl-[acyl-carrier-protein] dehydratase
MNPRDIEAIKKYLPHRYPFLMVDRVIDIIPGKSITALKNLSANEPFFSGHFPRMSVMPGVLMVEAMAQASGMLIYETLGVVPEGELYFLAGIDKVRFKRLVVPGDQLRLHVELTKHRLDVWKFTGTASVDGEVACIAEFTNIREQKSE